MINRRISYIFIFIAFLLTFKQISYSQISEFRQKKVLSNKIIIKLKKEHGKLFNSENLADKELKTLFDMLEVSEIIQKFPHAPIPTKKYNKTGQPLIDLSLLYEITYNADVSIEKIIHWLNNHAAIEYSEPHYIQHTLYEPIDPINDLNYHLDKIQAFQAWDYSMGSSDIIIGIVDMGIEFGHDDLTDNLYINEDEIPENDIDDDNDGYADNCNGWDLGGNDNNPSTESIGDPHGVWVTGFSSATPDNNFGITGTGYNCKYMPVKISTIISGTLVLNKGYEGIVYAADHGCSIINCSWYDGGGYTKYGRDIVNYATNNRNALVVAAAGNGGVTTALYPASFENAMSVGGTDEYDFKFDNGNPTINGGSQYNIYIDLCAPSAHLYTTDENNGFKQMIFGTSFSSPIVAGCAGLIKASFPDYSPQQIAAQLIVTTDVIDTIPQNIQYSGLLGSGRLNIYRALTESHPFVKFININLSDNNDGCIEADDTVIIEGIFINYLSQVTGLTATMLPTSSNIEIIDGQSSPGTLEEMESYYNDDDPFVVHILPGTPFDASEQLILFLDGDNFHFKQYIEIEINNTIIDIDTNNISTSITTRGRFGYKYLTQDEGLGFRYDNSSSVLFEGGLLIGTSGSSIANCYGNNNEFFPLSSPKPVYTNPISDYSITGKFSEYEYNLEITQHVHAWTREQDADYIITEYELFNPTVNSVENLYVAICSDWDVLMADANKIGYDEINKMSYTYYTESGIHIGTKLLSGGDVRHYAIDNIQGGAGGIDISSGFQDGAMYLALTNTRHTAGDAGDGNDVVDVFGTGPFSIPVGDTLKVAFAIIAGDNLFDLQNNALASQAMYDSIKTTITNIDLNNQIDFTIHPNPADKIIFAELSIENLMQVEISIHDILGNEVMYIEDTKLKSGRHIYKTSIAKLKNGIYYFRVVADNQQLIRKFIKAN